MGGDGPAVFGMERGSGASSRPLLLLGCPSASCTLSEAEYPECKEEEQGRGEAPPPTCSAALAAISLPVLLGRGESKLTTLARLFCCLPACTLCAGESMLYSLNAESDVVAAALAGLDAGQGVSVCFWWCWWIWSWCCCLALGNCWGWALVNPFLAALLCMRPRTLRCSWAFGFSPSSVSLEYWNDVAAADEPRRVLRRMQGQEQGGRIRGAAGSRSESCTNVRRSRTG